MKNIQHTNFRYLSKLISRAIFLEGAHLFSPRWKSTTSLYYMYRFIYIYRSGNFQKIRNKRAPLIAWLVWKAFICRWFCVMCVHLRLLGQIGFAGPNDTLLERVFYNISKAVSQRKPRFGVSCNFVSDFWLIVGRYWFSAHALSLILMLFPNDECVVFYDSLSRLMVFGTLMRLWVFASYFDSFDSDSRSSERFRNEMF